MFILLDVDAGGYSRPFLRGANGLPLAGRSPVVGEPLVRPSDPCPRVTVVLFLNFRLFFPTLSIPTVLTLSVLIYFSVSKCG